jgi:hypothetical protein
VQRSTNNQTDKQKCDGANGSNRQAEREGEGDGDGNAMEREMRDGDGNAMERGMRDGEEQQSI